MKIFLSAGHTPARPGAVASYPVLGDVAGDLVEHDLNREFVARVAGSLRLVEPSVVPVGRLRSRIAYVNRWARPGDYALEVHHNASTSPSANGVEAFFAPNSSGGIELAMAVSSGVASCSRKLRGAKRGEESRHGSLAWLRRTRPWAALLEVEFITNPEAAVWLVGGGLDEAAEAVARRLDELA